MEGDEGMSWELLNASWQSRDGVTAWYEGIEPIAGVLQGVFFIVGLSDLDLLRKFLPDDISNKWSQFDYGERLSGQFQRIMYELQLDPESNQTQLYIGDRDDDYGDRPHIVNAQVLLRGNELYATIAVREWHLLREMPYDVLAWTYAMQTLGHFLEMSHVNCIFNATSVYLSRSDLNLMPQIQEGPKLKVAVTGDWEGNKLYIRHALQEDWMKANVLMQMCGAYFER